MNKQITKNKRYEIIVLKLFFVLSCLLNSSEAYSCILGSERLQAKSEIGFLFEVEPIELCDNCEMVTITAPNLYKENQLMHLIFSTIVDDELKSRAYIPMSNDPNLPTFGVIITSDVNTKHGLQFVYGKSHCAKFSFQKEFSR